MFSLKFLFVFILTFSYAFANCDFDSNFADAYVKARKKYADSLRYQREQTDRDRKPTSGVFRARKFGDKWPNVSIKDQVTKMFGNSDVVIEPKMGGKIQIYSRNKNLNSKIIVFDPSGDYFRILEPQIRNGKYVTDTKSRHFSITGEELQKPRGMSYREWRDYESENTHFKAEF